MGFVRGDTLSCSGYIYETLRFTCKRWNCLFNDRRFTRKHSDKAAKQSLILTLKVSREGSIMRINLHRFSSEKLSLSDLYSSLDQTEFRQVSHCDGLLLCDTNTELVVWNPCTGQTRWIHGYEEYRYARYALGSYQGKISNDISYKILSRRGYGDEEEFGIYEMNSDPWRVLDVTINFSFLGYRWGVSLKGKTYWIARDKKEGHEDKFLLVSFDYTRERFEHPCLPHQYPIHHDHVSLSVVREEKLAMLLQRDGTSKTEIWVTNKIGDETKVVSWSMVFAVDLGFEFIKMYGSSFWIDEEEKKVVVFDNYARYKGKTRVHIVGDDNKEKQVGFVPGTHWPFLFSYVPSLTQI